MTLLPSSLSLLAALSITAAAHLRFRPIVMTSLAFMLGVLPLALATGASSASQRAIGTGVIGGMITGTVLAVIFVPIFFVVVRGFFKGSDRQRERYLAHANAAGVNGAPSPPASQRQSHE